MKVAIVGGSPSSDYLAPFDDPDWQIWVHGNQFDRHEDRRVSVIFEIHDDLTEHDSSYPKWLADKKIPMIVGREFPVHDDHIDVFPFDKANALIENKLTSTPAYMMAQAILDGANEIGIYGVDMAVDDHEYFYQRPAMYAWISYALAKGIKITIPDESPLFKDTHVEGQGSGGKPDLGLKPFTESQFLAMAQQHINSIAALHDQVNQIQAKIQTHDGCRQTYQRLAKVARAIEAGLDIHNLTDSAVIK